MSKDEEKELKPKGKIDEDTLSYFKRVESVIEDDDFEDEEARQLFIENVFTQIEGNELALCCDQAISRVLERLIDFFNDTQLKAMWKNLEKDFITVTTDRFGSHVLQHLVNSIPKAIRIERNESKRNNQSDQSKDSMEQSFISYCSFISDHLRDLVEDMYGSHVIRAVFEVLGGVHVVDTVQRSRNSRGCREKAFKMEERKYGKVQSVGQAFGISSTQTIAVPESFVPVLEGLTARVLDMDIKTLVYSQLSCPVLQTLLLVQHEKDEKLCSKLCKKIMSLVDVNESAVNDDDDDENDEDDKESKQSYQIPSLFTHNVGSHLVEKALHVASPKQQKKFFKKFFKGHLVALALHHVSNYLVQHLLTSTTDPTLGELMLDELLGEIEEIFSSGHDGVVARMAELSVRLEVKQPEFQKAILEAFHCTGKKERKKCATLVLCMTTYDILFGEEEEVEQGDNTDEKEETETKKVEKSTPTLKRINYHGAVLLKTLLDFQKPKVFVNSLLHMSKEELTKICRDLIGSRTIEALLKSQTVKIEKKNQFCDKLKGEFAALACDKSASHVVESCWREVDEVHKEQIAQELANEQHKLAKDFYGSKVLKKCSVEKYNKKNKGGKGSAENSTRKRQNFEEIFKDTEHKKKKSKRVEKKDKSNVTTQYATELAVLGFEQPNEDDNNNSSNAHQKESKKAKTQKLKNAMEDEIDLIFKSKKL